MAAQNEAKPNSIRQQIMAAIKTRFQGITVANGYQTNIGQNVSEWKDSPWGQDIVSGVDLRDPDCSGTVDAYPTHTFRMIVNAIAFAKSGATTPAEIRNKTLGDINKAIGVDPQWGGLSINTEPPTDSIIVEQAEKIIGGVDVTFVVVFRTKAWDPNTKM